MALSELDLDEVGTWPSWVKGFSYGLFGGLGCLLGYVAFLSPQDEQLTRLTSQIVHAHQRLKVTEKVTLALEQHQNALSEQQDRLRKLTQQIPLSPQNTLLLDVLSNDQQHIGIHVTQLDWLDAVNHEFHIEVPFQMELQGNYHQLIHFVEQVSQLEWSILVRDFRLKRDGSNLDMTLMGSMLYLPKEG
jgi:type IV pilus assembly protein PilO